MRLKKHLCWLVLGLALTLVPAGSALAAGNKLKIRAPKSVKIGTKYTVTTFGRATGKANFVIGVAVNSPCSSSWRGEDAALGFPSSVNLARSVHGKFKKKRSSTASLGGTVYWCAYLINKKSGKTYRHKSAHFTEHP